MRGFRHGLRRQLLTRLFCLTSPLIVVCHSSQETNRPVTGTVVARESSHVVDPVDEAGRDPEPRAAPDASSEVVVTQEREETPDVSDLPLVEVPVESASSGPFAILATGDGGWSGIDVQLSRELVKRGIPVVGLNSPRYLFQKKTPDEVGRDLRRIVHHYADAWHRERWIVLGYSRGAEMVPFMVSRLSAEDRAKTLVVAMLAPSHLAELEFHVADLVSNTEHGDLPMLPEVEKLRGMPVLCIYGTQEPFTLCRDLPPSLATVKGVEGGHHFGQHYEEIVQEIVGLLPGSV